LSWRSLTLAMSGCSATPPDTSGVEWKADI
jgi:hypothetical protein